MRPPSFWERDGILPALLAPAGAAVAWVTAWRMARPGWRAPVPVICCGNATIGGAGKTTLALDLGARLIARGAKVAFLSRGYGGRVTGVHEVARGRDAAGLVGDEALLLAEQAPTFVAADRAAGARAAIAGGAQVLVMDDGLQNPSLAKTVSLLVIDGAAGFGNARVLPAGPLREPVAAAAARCGAAVLIGADQRGALARLPGMAVLRADLQSTAEIAGLRVLAFAGIARPQKFFDGLRAAGADLAACRGFADHHPYRGGEIEALLAEAAAMGATAVTTPKDAVRLPAGLRNSVAVIGVRLVWQDEAALGRVLDEAWR